MVRKFSVCCFFLLLALSFTTAALAQAQAQPAAPSQPATAAPAEKKPGAPDDPKKETSLGLYVTAKEAYEMWQKDPDKIKILDCRTPEEYAFVGHSTMAVNVPSRFMAYRWDAQKKDYVMKDNPKFIQQVKKVFKPTDTIAVMCRSGHRSAASVEKLAKAGFKNVYNITDGFEGDKIKDKNDPNAGKRMKNGWKNSGLPWTYDFDQKVMYFVK